MGMLTSATTLSRSELRATDATSAARVRAEREWLALRSEHQLPTHVFRLGGAPGRPFVCGGTYAVTACPEAIGASRTLRPTLFISLPLLQDCMDLAAAL